MKKVLLFNLMTFAIMTNAFSQNMADDLLENDNCFLAVREHLDTTLSPKINAICIGQRITAKLKNDKYISGKIRAFSQAYILTTDGKEIDVNNIKWIKANKLTASRAITGTLMTAVGLALLPHDNSDLHSFDQAMFSIGWGTGLTIGGVAVLLSRPKFRLNKGDTLIFKTQELARTSHPPIH